MKKSAPVKKTNSKSKLKSTPSSSSSSKASSSTAFSAKSLQIKPVKNSSSKKSTVQSPSSKISPSKSSPKTKNNSLSLKRGKSEPIKTASSNNEEVFLLQIPKKETQAHWQNHLKQKYPFPEVILCQLDDDLQKRIQEIEKMERKTYTIEVEAANERRKKLRETEKKFKDLKEVTKMSKKLDEISKSLSQPPNSPLPNIANLKISK